MSISAPIPMQPAGYSEYVLPWCGLVTHAGAPAVMGNSPQLCSGSPLQPFPGLPVE